jgi:molecular chaperone DnaK (HSP70)
VLLRSLGQATTEFANDCKRAGKVDGNRASRAEDQYLLKLSPDKREETESDWQSSPRVGSFCFESGREDWTSNSKRAVPINAQDARQSEAERAEAIKAVKGWAAADERTKNAVNAQNNLEMLAFTAKGELGTSEATERLSDQERTDLKTRAREAVEWFKANSKEGPRRPRTSARSSRSCWPWSRGEQPQRAGKCCRRGPGRRRRRAAVGDDGVNL